MGARHNGPETGRHCVNDANSVRESGGRSSQPCGACASRSPNPTTWARLCRHKHSPPSLARLLRVAWTISMTTGAREDHGALAVRQINMRWHSTATVEPVSRDLPSEPAGPRCPLRDATGCCQTVQMSGHKKARRVGPRSGLFVVAGLPRSNEADFLKSPIFGRFQILCQSFFLESSTIFVSRRCRVSPFRHRYSFTAEVK